MLTSFNTGDYPGSTSFKVIVVVIVIADDSTVNVCGLGTMLIRVGVCWLELVRAGCWSSHCQICLRLLQVQGWGVLYHQAFADAPRDF